MSLTPQALSHAKSILANLESGQQINRKQTIAFFRDLVSGRNTDEPTQSNLPTDSPYTKQENTPQRQRVSNWKLGACKRCLENGVKDGDIIVRIFGTGWWHDACYRLVNPKFYEGI